MGMLGFSYGTLSEKQLYLYHYGVWHPENGYTEANQHDMCD